MTLEMRLRAAERAVGDVQQVIDEASRFAGTPDLVGSFRISSPLSIGGRDVVLQRDLQPCEGGDEFTADIKDAFMGAALTAKGIEQIRRHALEQSRGWLRQQSMRLHGEPAWNFEAHVLLHQIIRQSGQDVDLFAIADAQNWDQSRSVVEGNALRFAWGRMEIDIFQVASGYLTPTVIVRTAGKEWRMGLHRENPWILMDETYPETVAQSLVGRHLSDAMPHPLFESLPDIAITRVAVGETSTIINFEGITAPLAEVPEGVDVTWMKLPAHL